MCPTHIIQAACLRARVEPVNRQAQRAGCRRPGRRAGRDRLTARWSPQLPMNVQATVAAGEGADWQAGMTLATSAAPFSGSRRTTMIDSATLLAIPAAPPAAVVTPGGLVTSAAAAGRSGLGRRQRRAIGVVIGPQAKFEDICPARRLDIEALSRPMDPHAQIARRCARLVPAGAVLALPPPPSRRKPAGPPCRQRTWPCGWRRGIHRCGRRA
jgi:hypothetical protein